MIENLPFVVLSRQTTLQRQLDIIANNLANMNTTGFKRERSRFETYLMETKNAERPLNMVLDAGMTRDFTNGALKNTGNRFDLAIHGDGFFVVESDNGQVYSRNGNFQLNENGEIITKSGKRLLAQGGQPITLSAAVKSVEITQDGTISTNLGVLGKIELVDFKNKQDLRPLGDGSYTTDEDPTPVENQKIVQGSLETSNVQGIIEMTAMITTSRTYTSVANIISNDDQLRKKVMNTIGRMI